MIFLKKHKYKEEIKTSNVFQSHIFYIVAYKINPEREGIEEATFLN